MAKLDATIMKLYEKCLTTGMVAATNVRKQAKINEAAVSGRQFGASEHRGSTTIYQDDSWDDNLPRKTNNVIRGLMMMWSARLNPSRISVTAYPASDDPEDYYRAQVGNALIKYAIEKEQTAEKTTLAIQQACIAGTGGFRLGYDSEQDRITWDNISIFDFWIDNKADYRDARWVIFETQMDEQAAQELVDLHDAQMTVSESNYRLPNGETAQGVEVHEFFHKPNKDFPKGLYALCINEKLVTSSDYPFVVMDDSNKPQYLLPVVLMRARTVRGCVYGETNLSDVVPQQFIVNEQLNRELQWIRKTAGLKLVAPSDVANKWIPGEDQTFSSNTADGGNKPVYVIQPPEPPAAYARMRQEALSAMPSILGLNDQTTNQANTNLSGVALQTLVGLDAQTNSDALKSLENMVDDAYRLYFALVSKFYTVPRQMKVTSGDRSDVILFDGSDVIGVDLRLEIGSELDKRDDVQEALAEAKLKDGTGTTLDVQKAYNSPGYGMSRKISIGLISDYLAGKTLPDPMPGVDFDKQVFDQELLKAKAKAQAEGNKADWVALHALAKVIDDRAQELADAPPSPAAPDPNAVPQPTQPTAAPAQPNLPPSPGTPQ